MPFDDILGDIDKDTQLTETDLIEEMERRGREILKNYIKTVKSHDLKNKIKESIEKRPLCGLNIDSRFYTGSEQFLPAFNTYKGCDDKADICKAHDQCMIISELASSQDYGLSKYDIDDFVHDLAKKTDLQSYMISVFKGTEYIMMPVMSHNSVHHYSGVKKEDLIKRVRINIAPVLNLTKPAVSLVFEQSSQDSEYFVFDGDKTFRCVTDCCKIFGWTNLDMNIIKKYVKKIPHADNLKFSPKYELD
jgi:hypothetical protein